MDIKPFPLVSVSGTPFERGCQYGAAVPERIRRSIELYSGQLDSFGYQVPERRALIGSLLDEIGAFDAHYVVEMEGIAHGAKVALEDIVMINARTEVMAKARLANLVPPAAAAIEPDGCTGVAILPQRSADGRIIHGQNWDWRVECAETAIILRARVDDGPDFLTFVEAGGLARFGFNAAGIAITANYLDSDRDYRSPGVPLALIRRKVLEQEHFALAIRTVATTPKAASNNMILSTTEGFAIDLECAPDEAFPVYPADGLIVHANHWVSPAALSKLKETGLDDVPDSLYRDWRVRQLLDEAGPALTMDDLKAALFDDFGKPFSVCRPPHVPLPGSSLSATVAMIVMDPAQGVMDVAPLPALNRNFTRYTLRADDGIAP